MAAPRVTIPELPEQTTAVGTDLLVIQSGATTKKMLLSKIFDDSTSTVDAHVDDITDAHAASAIAAAPSSATVTGTTVQEQLDQIAGLIGEGGSGVPLGGTTGQLIVKQSDIDGDADWVDGFGTVTTPRLLDGDTGQFSNVTIVDDDTDSGTWPERFRWNYQRASDGRTRRVFFLNEYGEARCVPARDNTVPLRVFAQEFAADGTRDPSVSLIEIMDNRDDRHLVMTINNLGAAWFQGSLAVDGELFFEGEALAGALESIVLEAGDPAPAVGVWLRKA